MMLSKLRLMTMGELLETYPCAEDYFQSKALPVETDMVVGEFFDKISGQALVDEEVEQSSLFQDFSDFVARMEQLEVNEEAVKFVTIHGGHDKDGLVENDSLTISAGEIICIVGPTGSGKSRLLADIEWMAQGDTPTGRKILINGQCQ